MKQESFTFPATALEVKAVPFMRKATFGNLAPDADVSGHGQRQRMISTLGSRQFFTGVPQSTVVKAIVSFIVAGTQPSYSLANGPNRLLYKAIQDKTMRLFCQTQDFAKLGLIGTLIGWPIQLEMRVEHRQAPTWIIDGTTMRHGITSNIRKND
ncbi:hypothetical protein BDV26DRAFT_161831 [Aspergillus bertholletiae]|uniref:Uncharacterized protein n=1 Tax=Aspergillus bertholletiae TaxID=1226010 RepID=A0A5N7BP37_9EURO|nr:hypothetical protein BDV26DRAFT_161831 [Aspergillus bertholletiae]